ncbi:conserved hypothetical protein [Mucor ambiguus]|uniref:GATA-type domain-containing protein n=1 Tax=Mucor ambiguus TaxID=91626 RepID=A0A0C9MPG9_9FUNG|nr:conserved hypothetical protein [Mucor ambiguus]
MTPCIWSLLSVKELEFINASGFSQHLNGLSLFQLIHPDEVLMAKRDLFRFTKSHFLGGSVTRCRLKDYTSHDFSLISNVYIIVDIIMYVATGDTVLAFLHYSDEETPSNMFKNSCGDHINRHYMSSNNRFCALTLKEALIEQDKQHSPSLSTSSSLSSIESSQHHQNDCDSPHQFLYIVDSQTKSVLLSWPDHHHNEKGSADYLISSLDDRPMLPGISCFRCVQQPSRINSSGQRLNSLIVEYGSIAFFLVSLDKKNKKQRFDIPPPAPTTAQAPLFLSTKPVSLPCSPNKYNQLDEYPLRRTSEPYTTSNHSSPSHIHYVKPRKYQPYPTIPLENLLLPNSSDKQQQYSSSQHSKHHCQSCGTDSSPEWRRGPTGHKTLCNACGLRYSRSVARQGKMAANQQKYHQLQQHSLLQMPNTPQHPSFSSRTTSTSLSYN